LVYLDETALRLALRMAQDANRNECAFLMMGSLASESGLPLCNISFLTFECVVSWYVSVTLLVIHRNTCISEVIVADGCGVVINLDVLDVNKGSNASHLLTRKDLIADKVLVPFLVRSFY